MFESLALLAVLVIVGFGLAAGISHVITSNWTRSGEQLATNITLTAEGEINISHTWASAPTDTELGLAFLTADAVSIFIKSTQDATLETNATDATGGNTITLEANKPLVWYDGCGLANPFTQDVTTAYLTSVAVAGTIDIRVLYDGTP